jgi:hypothetical protein
MIRSNSALALVTLVCSLITLPARADVITTWTLTDLPLSDGTSLSGTITIDTTTDTLDGFDLTTQNGTLPGYDYSPNSTGSAVLTATSLNLLHSLGHPRRSF